MNTISSSRDAFKAALEVLTAYVDETDRKIEHHLSRELLMSYAPDPLPTDFQNFGWLAGNLVAMLEISVRAQAVFASTARGEEVSVQAILASLGQAIESST